MQSTFSYEIQQCLYSAVYPSYGPQLSYPCPSDYPYQLTTYWNINQHTENYYELLVNVNKAINYLQENYQVPEDHIFKMESLDTMSLTMQYLTCESEEDLRIIHDSWSKIEQVRRMTFDYKGIHSKFKPMEICFERVECIIPDETGTIVFDLFVDETSEFKLHRLVTHYENVEEDFIDRDLSFHRSKDQQRYHIPLGSLDGRLHDSVQIVKDLNALIMKWNGKNNWGCIDIKMAPMIEDKLKCDTQKLNEMGKSIWEYCIDLTNQIAL